MTVRRPANIPCPPALLEISHIAKSFSGVRVLNDISLQIEAGEVHAIMGENGAGKSTLMKVLAGVHPQDQGEVRLHGLPLQPGNPHAALQAGIAMIYQELLPFPDLSIAENIFMGQEPASRFFGWIDRTTMERNARELMARLGMEFRPGTKMRHLSVAAMQTVEIAKALAHRAEVIIMDEPTSALSQRETEALFRIIGELKRQGAAVLYISHKLEEVFRIADRVTVLRDGSLIGTYGIQDLTREKLIALMVGRNLQEVFPQARVAAGEIALQVRNLQKAGRFGPVSLEVRRGEILGLAGLMGAGRTNVVNAIYGLDPADSGEILVSGTPVVLTHPRNAIAKGIGLVTEDRKRFGLVPTLGVERNLTLAALKYWSVAGFLNGRAEARAATEQVSEFRIRAATNQSVDRLSGGNQQKVVLARTMLTQPQILLLDEPTRGIDIGAKAEVHALIASLARAGKAVLLVSSEMPELLSLSHRILVMRQGSITAELDARNTSQEQVLQYAIPR